MAKEKITLAGEHVELGPVKIAAAELAAMQATDVNGRGIVLANDRIKVLVPVEGLKAPVMFTASIYIQRDPIDDSEAENVTKTATAREQQKKAKAEDEQAKRERETKRAFELGQESTFGALRNVSALVAGADALNKLNK